MGSRRGEFSSGSNPGIDDLESLRERVLDHPDEEDAVSGHDIENNASTGPIKVVIRQDGIGKTGALILAIVAGLAIGIAVFTFFSYMKDFETLKQQTSTSYKELEREVRLNTQAVDELRVEVSVGRKLAGLPEINAQEHD